MDIDGYDGSELAPLDSGDLESSGLGNSEIDNSLSANFNEIFNQTSLENEQTKISNNIDIENQNQNQNQNIEYEKIEPMESKKENKSIEKYIIYLGIFVIVWIILGIIAFITSIVCFGFSGNITEKVLGLVLALLFGPFYFLYFYLNKKYCGKKSNSKSE